MRIEHYLRSHAVVAIATLFAAVASHADNLVGSWFSPPGDNWPLIAIHSTLTPDGRVLTYGTDGSGTQTGFFIYDVWDPTAGLAGGHLTLDNRTLTDLFCNAQVVLPSDGSIFMAGGDNWTGTSTTNTGNNNTNLFRYTDDSLTLGNAMNRPRWYATTTTLVNGEVYIQGGLGGEDLPEVRDINGNFRLLSKAKTGTYKGWYPRNFVAPDGRVFGFDIRNKMYYVATGGTGSLAKVGQFSTTYGERGASAAMYRPGKILLIGGKSKVPLNIDITSGAPVVTVGQTMSTKRDMVNATVLPDGRVLATGGSSIPSDLATANNRVEIWDPDTGTWTLGPAGSKARLYHSTALLLPDASVLVAGGGAPGPLTNLNAEIYYPPYLYTAGGAFAPRPEIVSAPDTLSIGQAFSVGVGAGTISRVTLVKTGAVTHSFNMDQRFLELSFTAADGTLFVQAPNRASDAPPGYYLLFVFDDQGVPSVGKIVKMAIQVDTAAPTRPAGFSLTLQNGLPRLAWSASSDNIGVAGYIVYRSTSGSLGMEIARTTASPWVNTTAVPGTTYYYTLKAYDVAGNVSAGSTRLSITVP